MSENKPLVINTAFVAMVLRLVEQQYKNLLAPIGVQIVHSESYVRATLEGHEVMLGTHLQGDTVRVSAVFDNMRTVCTRAYAIKTEDGEVLSAQEIAEKFSDHLRDYIDQPDKEDITPKPTPIHLGIGQSF